MSESRKVVVDVPGRPKGEPVEVLYLGVFENGATHEVSNEQVEAYEGSSGNTFPESGYLFAGEPRTKVQEEAFAENEKAKVSGAAVGFDPSSAPATQIDAVSTTPVNVVETDNEEEVN